MLDSRSSAIQLEPDLPEELDATIFAKKDEDPKGKVREIGDIDILTADEFLCDAGVDQFCFFRLLAALCDEEYFRNVRGAHTIQFGAELNQGE